jgi:predicted nucleotidyltransferase
MNRQDKAQPAWAITQKKLDDAVHRLVVTAKPLKIILFGSCGRGDNGIDSDVDILVVKKTIDNRYLELAELSKAMRGVMLAVDLLLLEEGELKEWCEVPGSVYRSAVREGKVVYEAV